MLVGNTFHKHFGYKGILCRPKWQRFLSLQKLPLVKGSWVFTNSLWSWEMPTILKSWKTPSGPQLWGETGLWMKQSFPQPQRAQGEALCGLLQELWLWCLIWCFWCLTCSPVSWLHSAFPRRQWHLRAPPMQGCAEPTCGTGWKRRGVRVPWSHPQPMTERSWR